MLTEHLTPTRRHNWPTLALVIPWVGLALVGGPGGLHWQQTWTVLGLVAAVCAAVEWWTGNPLALRAHVVVVVFGLGMTRSLVYLSDGRWSPLWVWFGLSLLAFRLTRRLR